MIAALQSLFLLPLLSTLPSLPPCSPTDASAHPSVSMSHATHSLGCSAVSKQRRFSWSGAHAGAREGASEALNFFVYQTVGQFAPAVPLDLSVLAGSRPAVRRPGTHVAYRRVAPMEPYARGNTGKFPLSSLAEETTKGVGITGVSPDYSFTLVLRLFALDVNLLAYTLDIFMCHDPIASCYSAQIMP